MCLNFVSCVDFNFYIVYDVVLVVLNVVLYSDIFLGFVKYRIMVLILEFVVLK